MNHVHRSHRTLALVVAAAFLAACRSQRADDDTNTTRDDARPSNELPPPESARPIEGAVSERLGGRELRQVWRVAADAYVTGKPIIDRNVIYAADWNGEVFAVDALTGSLYWRRSVHQPNKEWTWHGFSGTGAIDGSVLLEASTEGTLYALDKRTGDLRWQMRFTEQPNAGNCGAILARDGVVYVGVSSIEEGLSLQPDFVPSFIGEVVAVNTRDGSVLWKMPLTEAPSTGVAVWSGFALDGDTLYFTTGNNYTGEATELADAIVAVDAKTGAKRWHKQMTEGDVWTMAQPQGPDFDFGAGPQLFEATIGETARRLVGAGQKSGVFHALDRENGEIVWQAEISKAKTGGGMLAPAALDDDGRLYLWSNVEFEFKEPLTHPLDIAALDAATGNVIWRADAAQPAAATTGGVVLDEIYFVPSMDGRVRGYRTSDGKLVCTSDQLASVGSSLASDATAIYFGTGMPKDVGGMEGTLGLFCYRLGASPRAAAAK